MNAGARGAPFHETSGPEYARQPMNLPTLYVFVKRRTAGPGNRPALII